MVFSHQGEAPRVVSRVSPVFQARKSATLTTITPFLGVSGGRRELRAVGTTLAGLLSGLFYFNLSLAEHFLLLDVSYV